MLFLPLTKLFFARVSLGARLTKKRGESCGKVCIMFAIFVERAHTWTPIFLTSVDAAVHKEATVHVSDRSVWRLLKYDFVEDLEGLSRTCTSCKTPLYMKRKLRDPGQASKSGNTASFMQRTCCFVCRSVKRHGARSARRGSARDAARRLEGVECDQLRAPNVQALVKVVQSAGTIKGWQCTVALDIGRVRGLLPPHLSEGRAPEFQSRSRSTVTTSLVREGTVKRHARVYQRQRPTR
mmetsp:Transcript_28349/g.74796  ORF Transcript_28349/g.74796 Transcript_28349/m.74796 type:complete len:238 (-) Transcript_28349:103-816(-)